MDYHTRNGQHQGILFGKVSGERHHVVLDPLASPPFLSAFVEGMASAGLSSALISSVILSIGLK